MQELTQLVGILRSNEVRLIRRFYRIQSTDQDIPRLELFDIVRKQRATTDAEAARLIYRNKPNSAFSHLKKRLKQDIINLMLLQDGGKKVGSASDQAQFESRRRLIEGSVLISRGAHKVGERILKKAAELTDEYELPSEGLLINDLLRSHWGWKKGFESYADFQTKIDTDQQTQSAILTAKEYYHRIILPNQYQKNIDTNFELLAKEAMQKLQTLYESTKSARVGYFYNFIAMYYLQFRGEFKASLAYAQSLSYIVENEFAVYSASRKAAGMNQLAFIHLNLKDFGKSVEFANEAIELYREGTINHLSALEVKFCASLNLKNLDTCENIIELTKEHKQLAINKFTGAKWDFYEAGLNFLKQEFEKAYDSLNQATGLSEDRGGWLMGHKVLEILCMIEMQDFDRIEFRLESLQKLFQRQKEKDLIRIKSIKKVL